MIDPKGTKKNKAIAYNPFDIMELGKTAPHRRINHDPFSASLMSFMEQGLQGVALSNLHLYLDSLSEVWKGIDGSVGRDYKEAQLNYILEKYFNVGNRRNFSHFRL